jgi:hypothetical protein
VGRTSKRRIGRLMYIASRSAYCLHVLHICHQLLMLRRLVERLNGAGLSIRYPWLNIR